MANWSSEAEAREEIKELVAEYYHDFKEKKGVFQPGGRIPYASRVFDEKEMQALTDATLDFWLTTGRFSEQFEKEFADWIGVKHAHLVNSGSSANLIAFMALTAPELGDRKIKAGDEVITVACGFPTTVTPVLNYGAVPVFVDVTVPQYNIDATKLEEALSEKNQGGNDCPHPWQSFRLEDGKVLLRQAWTLAGGRQLRCPGDEIYSGWRDTLHRHLGRHRDIQLLSAPPHDYGRGRLCVYQQCAAP